MQRERSSSSGSEDAGDLEITSSSEESNRIGLIQNVKAQCRNEVSPCGGSSVTVEGNSYRVDNKAKRRLFFDELVCSEKLPNTPLTPVSSAMQEMNEDTCDSPWDFKDIFNNSNVRCCVGGVNEGAGGSGESGNVFVPVHNLESGQWIIEDRTIRRPQAAAVAPTKTTIGATGISGLKRKTTKSKKERGDKNVVSVDVKAKRKKPGKIFFVTVCLNFKPSMWDRTNFLSVVDCGFNDVLTFCVSAERSDKSENYLYHLHAFLEFSIPVLVGELCEYLKAIYCNLNVDCRPCRSKRDCLKYISKEDINLYTNVKVSSLHFNYRCYDWATKCKGFSCFDPFVVEHRFCYKFLERYYLDFIKAQCGKFGGLRVFCGNVYNNWSLDVVLWWNSCVKAVNSNNWGYKRKQLYLYGGTNVGKSTLIEHLIGKQNLKFVFYPGVGKFFMGGFDPYFHKVIVFEEFDIRFYKGSFLKRLLEGRTYAYPVKCKSDLVCQFKGPVIFVSNDNIELMSNDYALLGRLQIVNANCCYWQGPLHSANALPKEEVFSEEEVGEISPSKTISSFESD